MDRLDGKARRRISARGPRTAKGESRVMRRGRRGKRLNGVLGRVNNPCGRCRAFFRCPNRVGTLRNVAAASLKVLRMRLDVLAEAGTSGAGFVGHDGTAGGVSALNITSES